MTHQSPSRLLIRLSLILFSSILVGITGCRNSGNSSLPFIETFDEQGNWGTGEDAYSVGAVTNGVYDLKVIENDISRWVSAGKNFSDGIYEVEATPVEGPLDNGYGLIFRADVEKGNFYLFEVSSDGYVWIGRFNNGVADNQSMIGGGWIESPAVLRGLNVTNKLRVQAEAGNLIFFVNDQEVGRVTDNTFTSGDVGIFVQTLGGGGVRVLFDNLSVKPLPKT